MDLNIRFKGAIRKTGKVHVITIPAFLIDNAHLENGKKYIVQIKKEGDIDGLLCAKSKSEHEN